MQTMTLGPFLLSMAVVAVLLGVVAAHATAGFFQRRGHAVLDAPLWWLAVATLLIARLSYVLRWWDSYIAHPWSILDIRDGGFDVMAALAVLALGAALLAWRRKAWRLSLPVSVLVGIAVWGLVLGGAIRLEQAGHPPLPALTLDNLQGRAVALDSFVGQPAVINLWATWCGPCRREMPVLVQAQQTHPNLHVVFADQGESAAAVRGFLDANGLAPRHVLLDVNRELSQHYRAPGYPTTLFVDAAGHLQGMHIGELSHATLRDRIQRLIPTEPHNGESP